MDAPKDLFSKQAKSYATYRPTYPRDLYDFLFGNTPAFDKAWDCATGNGQVAIHLAKRFQEVKATDISEAQISHAQQAENIEYILCRAEDTPFSDRAFDLITVGTALHWFHFDSFYKEVRRVAKPGAHIAAWTYVPFHSSPSIDSIVNRLMNDILKDYWAEGRNYLDEKYLTIPFPFKEVKAPEFETTMEYSFEQLIGYIDSWSSVQEYKNRHNTNPIKLIEQDLTNAWGKMETRQFIFPLYMRIGRIN
jgi:ubiquinone/menaquinone biosynthesis C-methylase UbiE